MAITNIGTLQTAVESWIERTITDSLFLEWANDVANKLMYGVLGPDGRTYVVPPIRTRAMLATTTLTTSGGEVAIPATILELSRIWIDATDGTGINLKYYPLAAFRDHPAATQSGSPTMYTIDDATLYIAPTSDKTLQVSYYQTLGAFDEDSDADAILTAHPGVYLHGCLVEALNWIGDYVRADRELAEFAARAKALNAADSRFQTAGGLLIMRPGAVA